MKPDMQNPGVQAGASRDCFGSILRNSDSLFGTHRQAALALLSECPDLSHKAAGFLGHVCVAFTLTEKQRAWLDKLLDSYGLPALAAGGGNG